jgi:hypothetical protein
MRLWFLIDQLYFKRSEQISKQFANMKQRSPEKYRLNALGINWSESLSYPRGLVMNSK